MTGVFTLDVCVLMSENREWKYDARIPERKDEQKKDGKTRIGNIQFKINLFKTVRRQLMSKRNWQKYVDVSWDYVGEKMKCVDVWTIVWWI